MKINSYEIWPDANLDRSCWPLWCGSLHVRIDEQQARQLAYHLAAVLPEDCRMACKLHS